MESKEARVARLAQALRENLKKRKEQARDRDSSESISSVRHSGEGRGRDPEKTSN